MKKIIRMLSLMLIMAFISACSMKIPDKSDIPDQNEEEAKMMRKADESINKMRTNQ